MEDAINTDDNEATAVVAWNDPNAEDPEPEHPCITIPEMTSNHPPTMQIKFQITPQNSQGKFFIKAILGHFSPISLEYYQFCD